MKMSALKAMMMAGAMMVATLSVNASPVKMSQDSMKKGKKMGKMGKMKKMKKDTTSKM